MVQLSVDEKKLKNLLKETLIEVIEQKKDLFHDIVAEAIEDLAITNAIKEGESAEFTSREEVFKIIEGKSWRLTLRKVSLETSKKLMIRIFWRRLKR